MQKNQQRNIFISGLEWNSRCSWQSKRRSNPLGVRPPGRDYLEFVFKRFVCCEHPELQEVQISTSSDGENFFVVVPWRPTSGTGREIYFCFSLRLLLALNNIF